MTTSKLNDAVREIMSERGPSTKYGKKIRVYYATQTDVAPPPIVMFVNNPEFLDAAVPAVHDEPDAGHAAVPGGADPAVHQGPHAAGLQRRRPERRQAAGRGKPRSSTRREAGRQADPDRPGGRRAGGCRKARPRRGKRPAAAAVVPGSDGDEPAYDQGKGERRTPKRKPAARPINRAASGKSRRSTKASGGKKVKAAAEARRGVRQSVFGDGGDCLPRQTSPPPRRCLSIPAKTRMGWQLSYAWRLICYKSTVTRA